MDRALQYFGLQLRDSAAKSRPPAHNPLLGPSSDVSANFSSRGLGFWASQLCLLPVPRAGTPPPPTVPPEPDPAWSFPEVPFGKEMLDRRGKHRKDETRAPGVGVGGVSWYGPRWDRERRGSGLGLSGVGAPDGVPSRTQQTPHSHLT